MRKLITSAAVAVAISGALTYSALAAEGDYVVVLKNEPRLMLADNGSGVISNKGRVFVVESYMDAISLAPASEIACVFEDGIAYLFDDEIIDAPPVNDPYYSKQWGLKAINASYAWAKGCTGKGVRVGIIDSGMKRPSHTDLPVPSFAINAMASASDYTDYSDNFGHGTKVAGIIGAAVNNGIGIAGIAYDAELVPIKVTESKTLYLSDMMAGFEQAVDFNCQVINMSLGYTQTSQSTSNVTSIGKRIQQATDNGIIVVAAAGNSGTSEYQYPASYDCVVSVASIGTASSKNTPSGFSQHNDKVTLTAPGYQIYSTNRSGTYEYADGTSFSAPMVSAAAAIAKQINPSITNEEFIKALIATSRDLHTVGYDEYTGYGALDLQTLTDYLLKTAPNITSTPEPTASPQPTEVPQPSDTPVPEKSTLTYDGERYILTAVHEPFSSKTRIIAAFYEGDRLLAVKSIYSIDGNEVNKITYPTSAAITRAELFGWDFSDKSKPVPVSEKQVIHLSE